MLQIQVMFSSNWPLEVSRPYKPPSGRLGFWGCRGRMCHPRRQKKALRDNSLWDPFGAQAEIQNPVALQPRLSVPTPTDIKRWGLGWWILSNPIQLVLHLTQIIARLLSSTLWIRGCAERLGRVDTPVEVGPQLLGPYPGALRRDLDVAPLRSREGPFVSSSVLPWAPGGGCCVSRDLSYPCGWLGGSNSSLDLPMYMWQSWLSSVSRCHFLPCFCTDNEHAAVKETTVPFDFFF